MAVPTNRVVKHFDVVKDILACQLPSFVDFPLNALTLEQLEKAFSDGVVMAAGLVDDIGKLHVFEG